MTQQVQEKNNRMANLEALRCLAMMMVIMLHYLGKGNLLGDVTAERMDACGVLAWCLEALCIVAVNVYMMISGYFLIASDFKVSRLIRLYLQLWFYSVVIGVVAALLGVVAQTPVDTHYYLTMLFPVSMGHYWFLTAYVFLYLLLPFVGRAARDFTRAQYRLALGLLLGMFCIVKTVLPFRMEMDALGYDCIWYLCMFLTAGYIRKFGISFLNKKRNCALLYFGGCLGLLAELFALRMIYQKTGSFELLLKVSTEYNHLFPFLAAVGLFGLFLRVEVRGILRKAVLFCGPYTLGVYLLHENLGLRYTWQTWLGAGRIQGAASLFFHTVLAVLCVFVVGIALDALRAAMESGLCRMLSGRKALRIIASVIEKGDKLFCSRKAE